MENLGFSIGRPKWKKAEDGFFHEQLSVAHVRRSSAQATRPARSAEPDLDAAAMGRQTLDVG